MGKVWEQGAPGRGRGQQGSGLGPGKKAGAPRPGEPRAGGGGAGWEKGRGQGQWGLAGHGAKFGSSREWGGRSQRGSGRLREFGPGSEVTVAAGCGSLRRRPERERRYRGDADRVCFLVCTGTGPESRRHTSPE